MPADVLVVGGGVIGASVALACAADGRTVTIIDRSVPATASLAAGAMLSIYSEISSADSVERQDLDVAERRAGRVAYDDWLAGIAAAGGVDVPISPGMFVIANPEGEDDAHEVAAIAASAGRAGGAVERLDGRDVPGLAPGRRMPAFAAIHLPEEASLDSARLHRALTMALAAHPGITVIDDEVTRIATGDDVAVDCAGGGSHRAASVVLAGGVEIPRLLAASGLDVGVPPIVAGRGVSLLVRAAIAFPVAVRTPNRGFACGLHVVPRDDGALYVGATNRLSTRPDGHDLPGLSEIASLIEGAASQFNGALAGAGLIATRVGHRPVTPDRLPLVGRTSDSRVLIASATYRNGIVLAPRIGAAIAGELAAPGSLAGHPFDPLRTVTGLTLEDVIGTASRSLVASLEQPGGHLPYGRDEEMRRFITVALPAALGMDGAAGERLRAVAERLLRQAPAEEAIPLLFDLVTRER